MSAPVDDLARTIRFLLRDFHDGNIKFVISDNGDGKKSVEIVANDTRR